MPRCSCGSYDIAGNKFEEETVKKVLHAGHAAHSAGFHVASWGALATAGVMNVINGCRRAYRCRTCGNRFD
jgi:hypothetical protein